MKKQKYQDTEIKPCGHQGFETMPDGSCAVVVCGRQTRTPWHYEIVEGGVINIYSENRDDGWLASCGKASDKRDNPNEANAAFIVRAVNSHEELISFLKFLEAGAEDRINIAEMPSEQELLKRLKALLAKAING